MMLTSEFLHYTAIGLPVFLSAVGTGIGQGIAGASALEAMARQPLGSGQTFRAMVIGLALTESGSIFALVIAFILLATPSESIALGSSLAELGSGLAIGVAAAVVGIASSLVVKASCTAMSRQPFFAQRILTLMLLAQSIIEAPVIFSFIVALLIKTSLHDAVTLLEGFRYFSAGLVMALGCIGPATGQAIFAQSANRAIGLNTDSYKNIFTFSLLSQAVIETPVIFSLLVAFLILYVSPSVTISVLGACAYFAASISMGFGATGTGIANGFVGSKGCEEIALDPKTYPSILRATLLSQAIIEASVIYAFIIALILITRA